MAVDLNELNLLDDLEIETEGPESYADPTGPAPLPAGRYTFRLLDWEFDKDKNGELRNKRQPTVVLTLEVVGPEEYAGRKVRFLRVRSTPFPRNDKMVSQLGDLLRAFDASSDHKGKAKFEALSRHQANGDTFEARVDWRAFDLDHYKDLLGNTDGMPAAEVKMLKRKAGDASTIRGMKRFPQLSNGSYSPMVLGPSGAELRAEVEIMDFVVRK